MKEYRLCWQDRKHPELRGAGKWHDESTLAEAKMFIEDQNRQRPKVKGWVEEREADPLRLDGRLQEVKSLTRFANDILRKQIDKASAEGRKMGLADLISFRNALMSECLFSKLSEAEKNEEGQKMSANFPRDKYEKDIEEADVKLTEIGKYLNVKISCLTAVNFKLRTPRSNKSLGELIDAAERWRHQYYLKHEAIGKLKELGEEEGD